MCRCFSGNDDTMHIEHIQALFLCDPLIITLVSQCRESVEGFCAPAGAQKPSTLSYDIYGVSRVRSRGNIVVNRTLGAPVSCISRRSRPMANPPCGGMP